MRDSGRADRRHHMTRVKERRKHNWFSLNLTDRQIGKFSHTAKLCSCVMCGNPRKFFKHKSKSSLTIQELRQIQEPIFIERKEVEN